MSRLDKLKEEISFLKVIFSLFVAVDASIIAWLFNNSDKASTFKMSIVFFVTGVVSFIITITARKILKKIDNLEDL